MEWTFRIMKALVVGVVVLVVIVGADGFKAHLQRMKVRKRRKKIFRLRRNAKSATSGHSEYEESVVARAIVTPTFRAMLEDYASKGKEKSFCLNCHAPQATVFPDLADNMVKQIVSGDPTFEGVGCVQCHLIKSVEPNVKGHPPIKLEPGRTVFGGYKDPIDSKAHDTQFLELYKNRISACPPYDCANGGTGSGGRG